MRPAYYNENDWHAAAWLRNLIEAGEIPAGDVDERSIVDVRPSDLAGYAQVHLFAGIGGWPLILQLAGWPPDRPVWTGSCPCQPFSVAGRRAGTSDARHLWPEFGRLVGERGPAIVFGEQVASAAGRAWLAAVRADLEGMGYAVGAADLCAAGVGAPHIRQRLWWVGKRLDLADGERWIEVDAEVARGQQLPDGRGGAGRLGDPGADGRQGRLPGRADPQWQAVDGQAGRDGTARWVAVPGGVGWRREGQLVGPGPARPDALDGAGAADGFWGDPDWLLCRDGRWRPVEPGTQPLAHGVSGRVGKLRAYGNATVPQVGALFVRAVMEA